MTVSPLTNKTALCPRRVAKSCFYEHATHQTATALRGLRCEEITFCHTTVILFKQNVLLFKHVSQYSHILNCSLSEDTETGAPITTRRSVYSVMASGSPAPLHCVGACASVYGANAACVCAYYSVCVRAPVCACLCLSSSLRGLLSTANH